MGDWERIFLLVKPGMKKAIETWRKHQEPLPNQNEALRELLRRQLTAEGIHIEEDPEQQ